MENLKVTIVIPCLNEAETIQRAIAQALEGIRLTGVSGEVLVADNGSMDGSQSLSEHAGARVVSVPEKGYGAALHGGILAARGEIVVMGDADLSYPFLETTNLVTPILERRA
ncbi:MAG: glycosyltransferase family 2 protein, partial [Pseudobdellovibrionaceae bacterium]